MEFKDIISIILGLYSAFLTTYIYKKSIQEKRRRFVFSHEFDLLKDPDGTPTPFLTLRVNNGGGTNIDLVEIGFTSKSGMIEVERDAKKIVTLEPGESHTVSVHINDHLNELGLITGYYAKDSFGEEHKYSLLSPLSEQMKNAILLKDLYGFGYRNEVIWLGFEQAVKRYENGIARAKDELEILASKYEKEDEEFRKKQEEWDKYKQKTGKTHPDRERNIKDILDKIKSGDNDSLT
jgi:hypothetical protein